MKRSTIIFAAALLLAVLHQDCWNWGNADTVLGFMPVGLAYHTAYSIVVAIFWALVIRFAWPTRLEAWAEESSKAD